MKYGQSAERRVKSGCLYALVRGKIGGEGVVDRHENIHTVVQLVRISKKTCPFMTAASYSTESMVWATRRDTHAFRGEHDVVGSGLD